MFIVSQGLTIVLTSQIMVSCIALLRRVIWVREFFKQKKQKTKNTAVHYKVNSTVLTFQLPAIERLWGKQITCIFYVAKIHKEYVTNWNLPSDCSLGCKWRLVMSEVWWLPCWVNLTSPEFMAHNYLPDEFSLRNLTYLISSLLTLFLHKVDST